MCKLYIFILVILLEIILDFSMPETMKCIRSHPEVAIKLILHHVVNCFLLYGWILDNIILLWFHVLVSILVIIYWLSNSNLCDLTVDVNNVCGWKKDVPFKDLLYISGIKSIPNWNSRWHYILVVAFASTSLYKIYRS